jgi:fumarate hydratase class II
VIQVCARVFGNDATVTWCAAAGSNFELNVMMPALAAALLESIDLLANASQILSERCVVGIEARKQRCNELIESSHAMVTGLISKIGYDRAAIIAKESANTGVTVRELCLARLDELGITVVELNEALDPTRMSTPDAATERG